MAKLQTQPPLKAQPPGQGSPRGLGPCPPPQSSCSGPQQPAFLTKADRGSERFREPGRATRAGPDPSPSLSPILEGPPTLHRPLSRVTAEGQPAPRAEKRPAAGHDGLMDSCSPTPPALLRAGGTKPCPRVDPTPGTLLQALAYEPSPSPRAQGPTRPPTPWLEAGPALRASASGQGLQRSHPLPLGPASPRGGVRAPQLLPWALYTGGPMTFGKLPSGHGCQGSLVSGGHSGWPWFWPSLLGAPG